MTKKDKLRLSRRSYYLILLLVLILCLGITIAIWTFERIEMAAKFVPTVAGLIVTLLFFHIFFDKIREFEKNQELEKLRNTIGSRIYFIFQELVTLCDVDSALRGEESEDAWKALWNRQVKELASKVTLGKMIVGYLWVDEELRSSLSSRFADNRIILIEAVNRCEDLNAQARVSFIHFERLLKELSFRLVAKDESKPKYERVISDLIQKIMKEILELRNSGIDIGF